VVLITGCSSGIGRALVHEFRNRQCRVFASARDLSKISDLGEDVVQLDVLNPISFKNAVDEVVRRAGRIDILVNNAGLSSYVPAVEVKPDEVRRIFDTNFFSVVELTQHTCLKYMIPARSGAIVMISSMAADVCSPFNATYSASKAAVARFTDGLRLELAPFGIKVVLVKPGGVQSDIAKNSSPSALQNAAQSLYSPIEKFLRRRAFESQEHAMPAEAFAKKVVTDILRSYPPCIITGTKSTLLQIVSHFPYWLFDFIMSRRYGLSDLKRILYRSKKVE